MVFDLKQDIDLDDCWGYDVAPFDKLTPYQKLALLEEISRALLLPEVPPLELTSLNEAAIYAIYHAAAKAATMEIETADFPDLPSGCDIYQWRKLVIAATAEVCGDPNDFLEPDDEFSYEFSHTCTNEEEFEEFCEMLSDHVLWDQDYLMEDEFLDLEPWINTQEKYRMGIHSDYYSAILPDPRDFDLPALYDSLRQLCGEL